MKLEHMLTRSQIPRVASEMALVVFLLVLVGCSSQEYGGVTIQDAENDSPKYSIQIERDGSGAISTIRTTSSRAVNFPSGIAVHRKDSTKVLVQIAHDSGSNQWFSTVSISLEARSVGLIVGDQREDFLFAESPGIFESGTSLLGIKGHSIQLVEHWKNPKTEAVNLFENDQRIRTLDGIESDQSMYTSEIGGVLIKEADKIAGGSWTTAKPSYRISGKRLFTNSRETDLLNYLILYQFDYSLAVRMIPYIFTKGNDDIGESRGSVSEPN